jgi:hypothetical protein
MRSFTAADTKIIDDVFRDLNAYYLERMLAYNLFLGKHYKKPPLIDYVSIIKGTWKFKDALKAHLSLKLKEIIEDDKKDDGNVSYEGTIESPPPDWDNQPKPYIRPDGRPLPPRPTGGVME